MPRRVLQGTVVSDKGDKTVIVKVERRVMHPVYKKFIRQSKRYAAHDETNQFKTGDQVFIEESRPLSRTKRWIAHREQPAVSSAPVAPVPQAEAG
jgi:small subunit ribosomal protein S17